MQPKVVLSFRKRLKNCGYTNISIKMSDFYEGLFDVSAVEPLGKTKISVRMSLGDCSRFKSKNS